MSGSGGGCGSLDKATQVIKYHYYDYDTDVANETPPTQNIYYEVFDAEDVRLIICAARQKNDESAAKDIQVRWTIDGNVYRGAQAAAAHNSTYYFWRHWAPSAGGTGGLSASTVQYTAGGQNTDKRGQSFKVEVRITSVVGTNQILDCWCVRETLEET